MGQALSAPCRRLPAGGAADSKSSMQNRFHFIQKFILPGGKNYFSCRNCRKDGREMLTNPGKAFIVTTVPSVKCREQDTTSPNTAFRKPPVVRDGSKDRAGHPL